MELTREQIGYLGQLVRNGTSVQTALLEEFSNADLSIVIGYDDFAGQPYVQNAFFWRRSADGSIREIMPNSEDYELADRFGVVTGTVRELEDLHIPIPESLLSIDEIHRRMTYIFLDIRVKEV
jgi:hypothetical protein